MDRLLVQSALELILESGNVYYQAPPNNQMAYPAIVYKRDTVDTKFADNCPYRLTQRYQVTYIDRNPDSVIPAKLASLPMSLHNRSFQANNLNHEVFIIYF